MPTALPHLRVLLPAGAMLALLGFGLAMVPSHQFPMEAPPVLAFAPENRPGLSVSLQPLPGDPAAMLPAGIGGVASPFEEGFRQEWPGFHAEARFSGPGLILRLDDGANRYRIRIDDRVLVLTRPGAAELRIGELGEGEHRVRLEKLGESGSPAWFGGFFLPPGSQPLPPPDPGHVIEFLGDSDSVGYGIASGVRTCSPEVQALTTDATRAFPALVAENLGMDYRVIARSGITLVRNPGNMGAIHALALPGDPRAPLAPQPAAEIIVIGLGSNDLAQPLTETEWPGGVAGMRTALARGVEDLARAREARSPGARLVLLAFGEYGPDLVEPYRQAQAALLRDGFHADLLVLPGLARTACHWHPSPEDHELIAAKLTDLLVQDGFSGGGGLPSPLRSE
jgi:lysophospholipase L1-like esterase